MITVVKTTGKGLQKGFDKSPNWDNIELPKDSFTPKATLQIEIIEELQKELTKFFYAIGLDFDNSAIQTKITYLEEKLKIVSTERDPNV